MTEEVQKRRPDYYRIFYALGLSTLVSIGLLLVESEKARSGYFLFLYYNLILAYIPALLAWWLSFRLDKTTWLSFGNIILTILWVGFLPNSFYMITDLLHANSSVGYDALFNYAMLISFIFNGLVAGFISLYLIHRQLLKRLYYRNAHIIIAIVLFLCSFAIYLGRYLRWNSWDVIINPAGILFDIGDSITNPSTHPGFITTVVSFFLLLSTMYIVIWQLVRSLRKTD